MRQSGCGEAARRTDSLNLANAYLRSRFTARGQDSGAGLGDSPAWGISFPRYSSTTPGRTYRPHQRRDASGSPSEPSAIDPMSDGGGLTHDFRIAGGRGDRPVLLPGQDRDRGPRRGPRRAGLARLLRRHRRELPRGPPPRLRGARIPRHRPRRRAERGRRAVDLDRPRARPGSGSSGPTKRR